MAEVCDHEWRHWLEPRTAEHKDMGHRLRCEKCGAICTGFLCSRVGHGIDQDPYARERSTRRTSPGQTGKKCTHGTGDPNACPECTKSAVLSDPVARAAYEQNRHGRGEKP